MIEPDVFQSQPRVQYEAVDPQPNDPGNHVALPGQVWICRACGKRSHDRYGFQKIDRGWDESCMLNAVLCTASSSRETP